MTDDVRILTVDSADNREWLVTARYVPRPDQAAQVGQFQAHTRNRGVVALCLGAKRLDAIVRVHWREGRSTGFRDLLFATVL